MKGTMEYLANSWFPDILYGLSFFSAIACMALFFVLAVRSTKERDPNLSSPENLNNFVTAHGRAFGAIVILMLVTLFLGVISHYLFSHRD